MSKLQIHGAVLCKLARTADRGVRIAIDCPESLDPTEVAELNTMFQESVIITIEKD